MHLEDMGCSLDQFAQLCESYGSTDVGKEVLEQILAVDDFISFKKMMVKRNMELEYESLRGLQSLSDQVEAGAPTELPADPDESDGEFEAEMKASASTHARVKAREAQRLCV